MKTLNVKSTLGDIVANYPSTTEVMNKYKLDYCCGGKDTLEKALSLIGTEASIIMNELEDSINNNLKNNSSFKNWKEESLSNVIAYILDKHHTFMKKTLNELNELVFKILKVHYETDGEILLKVHQLFGTLKTELEAHLVKEEENLFPLIIEYEKSKDSDLRNKILDFINDTEEEHDAAGDLFKELEIITKDFKPPIDACYSYKRTYELLEHLEKDTFNHIHMENSILFEML